MLYIKLVLKNSKGIQWQKQGRDFREETELEHNPKMTFIQRQSRGHCCSFHAEMMSHGLPGKFKWHTWEIEIDHLERA